MHDRLSITACLLVASAAVLFVAPAARLSRRDDSRSSHDGTDPPTFVGSESCRPCHAENHASWHRSFHRTMTQEATRASVRAPFDGSEVTFDGVTARPVLRDGMFIVEYLDRPGGKAVKSLPILRTVGSRRYQQYLTQDAESAGTNYYRIPILWHLGESRWIHLNGAFLGDDGAPYDEHLALWNQNCLFCHNTGPEPGAKNLAELATRRRKGEDVDPAFDGRYASKTAELGIACEACHGPGSHHVAAERLRAATAAGGATVLPAASTIVNPESLEPRRSIQVCGVCHGGRIPKEEASILEWLRTGIPFRPGDDLDQVTRPIFRETPPPGAPANDGLFSLRFWNDGTPRLSAYEYQGILLSPCHTKGGLTCINCHAMHGDDIYGQIRPGRRTNEACAPCHQALVDDPAPHTHHAAASEGSSCYECHLPRIVFGVLEIHRSHRIERPDPARDAEAGRPNACTLCHIDRSAAWAAAAARKFWGSKFRTPAARASGASLELPDSIAAMHAGDAAERAVALAAVAGLPAGSDAARRAFLAPHLIAALGDRWPAVRWFARRALIASAGDASSPFAVAPLRAPATAFDYLAPPAARELIRADLDARWRSLKKGAAGVPEGWLLLGDSSADGKAVEALRARQAARVIRIGE